jgi:putative FmdB family regulatory protein
MPIFEFRCQTCGKEFERLVFKSDEVVDCPACGQQTVNRLMSVCSFKTDYHGMMSTPPSQSAPSTGKSSCTGCAATSCSTCG